MCCCYLFGEYLCTQTSNIDGDVLLASPEKARRAESCTSLWNKLWKSVKELFRSVPPGVFSRLASAKVQTFLITKKPFPYFSYKKVDFYQKRQGIHYIIYICPDKNHETPHIPCGTLLGSRGVSHNVGCTRPLSHVFSSRFYQKWQWFLRNFKENAYFRTKYNNKIVARLARRENVCWEQTNMIKVLSAWKALRSEATITGYEVPGKVGLGRCAWNFRANESNQVYLNCRVQPKISKNRHYAKGQGLETFPQAYCLPGR